eukprot:PLAT7952.1.p1 GENE.PLAT7952.1~~PLAT7952.1.p1  ORF type:complete len:547 (+),score=102.70 PLAT7952.1:24-1664(+)
MDSGSLSGRIAGGRGGHRQRGPVPATEAGVPGIFDRAVRAEHDALGAEGEAARGRDSGGAAAAGRAPLDASAAGAGGEYGETKDEHAERAEEGAAMDEEQLLEALRLDFTLPLSCLSPTTLSDLCRNIEERDETEAMRLLSSAPLPLQLKMSSLQLTLQLVSSLAARIDAVRLEEALSSFATAAMQDRVESALPGAGELPVSLTAYNLHAVMQVLRAAAAELPVQQPAMPAATSLRGERAARPSALLKAEEFASGGSLAAPRSPSRPSSAPASSRSGAAGSVGDDSGLEGVSAGSADGDWTKVAAVSAALRLLHSSSASSPLRARASPSAASSATDHGSPTSSRLSLTGSAGGSGAGAVRRSALFDDVEDESHPFGAHYFQSSTRRRPSSAAAAPSSAAAAPAAATTTPAAAAAFGGGGGSGIGRGRGGGGRRAVRRRSDSAASSTSSRRSSPSGRSRSRGPERRRRRTAAASVSSHSSRGSAAARRSTSVPPRRRRAASVASSSSDATRRIREFKRQPDSAAQIAAGWSTGLRGSRSTSRGRVWR